MHATTENGTDHLLQLGASWDLRSRMTVQNLFDRHFRNLLDLDLVRTGLLQSLTDRNRVVDLVVHFDLRQTDFKDTVAFLLGQAGLRLLQVLDSSIQCSAWWQKVLSQNRELVGIEVIALKAEAFDVVCTVSKFHLNSRSLHNTRLENTPVQFLKLFERVSEHLLGLLRHLNCRLIRLLRRKLCLLLWQNFYLLTLVDPTDLVGLFGKSLKSQIIFHLSIDVLVTNVGLL